MGVTFPFVLGHKIIFAVRFCPNLVVILSCYVRKLRTALIYVLVFLLVFFWTVPVAFASTLVSLQNLTKVAPFLKPGEILLFY